VLLACNDTGTDNINDDEQNNFLSSFSSSTQASSSSSAQLSNFCENPQSNVEGMPPAMDCRVVSFQKNLRDFQQLGYGPGYGAGFTTDEEILKSWFPHIFNADQVEPECNYFALYLTGNSGPYYYILSQDMTLYHMSCTWSYPPGISSEDIVIRAMLICDDKDWKLKESINLDSTRSYKDPNWECESGMGGPSEEDVYF
jgi:hypothetical protein